MPAAKRSRNSGARASTTRGKRLKANVDSAVTNGKHSVSDDASEEQTRVTKRTKISQTSANPERWTPYFKSRKLHTVDGGEAMQLAPAGDEQAGDSKGLETAAMQECQSIRNTSMEVIGPNGKPLDLRKLRAEFDTGADECVMTQSCYLQLKELLKFKTGELDIEGVTEGEIRMTQYVELNLKIGSINFPPGIKFWVDEELSKDASIDVLLSGPFLAHHNVIYLDPKLQREIEKDGHPHLKIQKHFDFLVHGVPNRLTKSEKAKSRARYN